jgi:hypothetical protein
MDDAPNANAPPNAPAGTIVKFDIANQKGPHFADPLEMWGEALLWLGRKADARAKFHAAASLDLSVAEKAELASDVRR